MVVWGLLENDFFSREVMFKCICTAFLYMCPVLNKDIFISSLSKSLALKLQDKTITVKTLKLVGLMFNISFGIIEGNLMGIRLILNISSLSHSSLTNLNPH